MNRRQFLPAALAGIAAPKVVPAAPKPTAPPFVDRWRAAEKKTPHNLPCEEEMVLRLNNLLDALHQLEIAAGNSDPTMADECFHIHHFVEGQESLISGMMYHIPRLKAKRPNRYAFLPAPLDRVLFAMLDAQDAIKKVHDVHGLQTCDCLFCWDCEHLRWFLEAQESLLGSIGIPSMAWMERRHGKEFRELLEEGMARLREEAAAAKSAA
ncbi:hypothetical protein AYO44_03845 [Planctomycetaceae bacterium SCGC AG-212-F19]|nr:hypothetical protein AYO44_03845 [Planctomycetaceae bacterium SCGC AG-212-F19]